MAKTNGGKKIVTVHAYTREVNGKPVKVPDHKRSTPTKCK